MVEDKQRRTEPMQAFTNIIIMDITEQSGKNSLMNSMMKSIFQKFIPLPAG